MMPSHQAHETTYALSQENKLRLLEPAKTGEMPVGLCLSLIRLICVHRNGGKNNSGSYLRCGSFQQGYGKSTFPHDGLISTSRRNGKFINRASFPSGWISNKRKGSASWKGCKARIKSSSRHGQLEFHHPADRVVHTERLQRTTGLLPCSDEQPGHVVDQAVQSRSSAVSQYHRSAKQHD
jgi:hypothetical protein